jgi:hypothetical protein
MSKGVILTKDNLSYMNWRGDDKCCFCNNKETIHHLFFDCHVAQFVWRVVQFAFGLQVPTDIADIFRSLAPTNKLKNKTSSLCGSMCNFLIYLVVPQ